MIILVEIERGKAMKVSTEYAVDVAGKYYSKETLEHAKRVARYIEENAMIPAEQKERCLLLAIMHDLIEDTSYSPAEIEDEYFKTCLYILTKHKKMDYLTYIKKIKSCCETYPEAYWVKLADMKDHLAQRETLTERLKEKYLKALPELL